MDYEEIESVLNSLYIARMAFEYDMLDHLIEQGYTEPSDDDLGMSYELLFGSFDFFASDYDETQSKEKWYFSFNQMNEFYRLCREYGSRHCLPLKENRFFRDADSVVHRCLEMYNAYDYNWVLHTGVGHEWASGITFWYGEEFYQISELAECILFLKEWFTTAVENLKMILVSEVSTADTRKELAS